uniref:Uncharacterized protein n=1 Tax=Anguilla anguilla TaxID=7936 RepID=A0A0E9SLZ2_ANGAN
MAGFRLAAQLPRTGSDLTGAYSARHAQHLHSKLGQHQGTPLSLTFSKKIIKHLQGSIHEMQP